MQCSAEEIEEKRRIAQAKLRAKSLSSPNTGPPSPQSGGYQNEASSSGHNSTTPIKNQFNFRPSPIKHNSKPYDKPIVQQQQKAKITEERITAKFCLISEERFKVETSYSEPVIEIFKTIPTRHYTPATRIWDFDIKDYKPLITKLNKLKVITEGIPNYVIKCLQETKRDISNIELNNLDTELISSLMPFQLEGARYVIDKDGRALIADDMGLGKTFQALAVANFYIQDWPLLVITTKSTKNVWEDTISRYMPSVPLHQIKQMHSAKDYIGDANILIVTYKRFTLSVDDFLRKNFGVIIFDESHNLKTSTAQCTIAAKQVAQRAKRIILLSGTPSLSRPTELYSQLELLEPYCFGGFRAYSRRYCEGRQTQFGWDSSGASNLQELEIILRRRFMIRRNKEDVLKILPNKKQELVKLDVNLTQFSAEDRACLTALSNKYRDVKGSQRQAALLTFFAETAKIKIPSVCSYILRLIQTSQKFLVFAHHKLMMNAISEVLVSKNVDFIRIDGSSSSEQRRESVDRFQLRDDCQVAVLSIMAANAGITLTAAQLVVFAELHWNPGVLSQAESRAHRIGQQSTVVVKYLIGPGTADDWIWPMLQEKQKNLAGMRLSRENFDNVVISSQDNGNAVLTENLNITNFNDDNHQTTEAGTLDISSYFKTNPNDSGTDGSLLNDWLDDGMDDILLQVDM